MLSCLARQEGGIKFLIDIRADILVLFLTKRNERSFSDRSVFILLLQGVLETEGVNVVALRAVANAIRDLIAPCFGIDLLNIDRVTWSSPGHVLQSISEGEAVHPIRSWSDLKKRLGPYRRCFILSHPAVPRRPLAILHVALTTEISSNIHTIISRNTSLPVEGEVETAENEEIQRVNTAIFYSISSTQKGLSVRSFGDSCQLKV